jgi:hypothetical protein
MIDDPHVQFMLDAVVEHLHDLEPEEIVELRCHVAAGGSMERTPPGVPDGIWQALRIATSDPTSRYPDSDLRRRLGALLSDRDLLRMTHAQR